MQFASVSESQVILKVVNGAPVRTNASGNSPFPFFVQIRRIVQAMGGKEEQRFSQMVCGGTVVHSWKANPHTRTKAGFWVLSAAHCLQTVTEDYSVNVFLGGIAPYSEIRNNDIFGSGIPNADGWYEIPPGNVLIYNHPLYTREKITHDIALLRCILPTGMDLPQGMIPAQLPKNELIPNQCNVLGFGITDVRNPQNSTTLQYGSVRVEDPAIAQRTSTLAKFDPQFHTWAAGQTQQGRAVDTCQGDSGGPLFHMWERFSGDDGGESLVFVLYGVASWGVSCGVTEYPGVYAKVWPFVESNTLSPSSSPWSKGIAGIIADNSPGTAANYVEPEDFANLGIHQQSNPIFDDPSKSSPNFKLLISLAILTSLLLILVLLLFRHSSK